MTRENMRYKLIVPNSGNEVYNKGIRIANSRANKLFKQIFDYFELSMDEARKIKKDNHRKKRGGVTANKKVLRWVRVPNLEYQILQNLGAKI